MDDHCEMAPRLLDIITDCKTGGWGRLKDIVINNQERYATDEFQHLYTCSLNINWPYRDKDILVFEGEEVRVTDDFARYVYTQSNWSLDEPFQRRYPDLRDACGFTELPGQHTQQLSKLCRMSIISSELNSFVWDWGIGGYSWKRSIGK